MDFSEYRKIKKQASRQVILPGVSEPLYVRLATPAEMNRAEVAMRAYMAEKKVPVDSVTDVTAAEMKEREITAHLLAMTVFEDEGLTKPWAAVQQIKTLDEVAFRLLDHEQDLLMMEERGSVDIYSVTAEEWEEGKKKLREIPWNALSGRQRRALGSFLAALSSSD
jgi:hypothetical protein